MAELITIRMEGDSALVEGNLLDMAKMKHLLRDALDDIADAVEDESKKLAPVDTGKLKEHPVDREDTRVGIAEPRAFSFGGGISARGAGGRFTAGNIDPSAAGQLVGRSIITVAEEPFYAKFVHDGTGLFGPKRKPYTARTEGKDMVFYYHKGRTRKFFRLKFVKGQKPEPYLVRAYLLVDRVYAPARIDLLRAQIAAET